MKAKLLFFLLIAGCCFGARVNPITINLERSKNPIRLTWTEATATTVSAKIKRYGTDYITTGWTGTLWYGTSQGGVTITNNAASRGKMEWIVSDSNMPTNGRYSVMIFGHSGSTVEEWATGVLTVRLNPAKDSLPISWNSSGYIYDAATNALAVAQAGYIAGTNAQATAESATVTGTNALAVAQDARDTANAASSASSDNSAAISVLQTNKLTKLWASSTNYVDGNLVKYEIVTADYVSFVFPSQLCGWETYTPPSPLINNFAAPTTTTEASFNMPDNWQGYLWPEGSAHVVKDTDDLRYIWQAQSVTAIGEDVTLYMRDTNYWTWFLDEPTIEVQWSSVVLTNVIDSVIGTNGTVIILGSTTDAEGSTTNLQAKSGESTLDLPFFGKSEFKSIRDYHTDSYTNVVWKEVFSNGWHFLVAYTNTPTT